MRFCLTLFSAGLMLVLSAVAGFAQTYNDGLSALKDGDAQKAVEVWRGLADGGDSAAQYSLALLLESGQNGVAVNLDDAVRYYDMAANAGVPEAQTNLGLMYAEGRGVNRNPELAAEYWSKSAASGHAMALFNLGLAYYQGTGVPQSQDEATALIYRAAMASQPEAQFAIGQFFRHGLGVGKDLREALYWYKLASRKGHPDARTAAAELSAQGIKTRGAPDPAGKPRDPLSLSGDLSLRSAAAPTVEPIETLRPEPQDTATVAAEPDVDAGNTDGQSAAASANSAQPSAPAAQAPETTASAPVAAENAASAPTSEGVTQMVAAVEPEAPRVREPQPEPDVSAQVKFLEPAQADVAFRRALLLLQSPGLDRRDNGREAVILLFNAAISGNPKAQRALGELYLLGIDIRRSADQALYWLREAELNGIADINGFVPMLQLQGITRPTRHAAAPVFN